MSPLRVDPLCVCTFQILRAASSKGRRTEILFPIPGHRVAALPLRVAPLPPVVVGGLMSWAPPACGACSSSWARTLSSSQTSTPLSCNPWCSPSQPTQNSHRGWVSIQCKWNIHSTVLIVYPFHLPMCVDWVFVISNSCWIGSLSCTDIPIKFFSSNVQFLTHWVCEMFLSLSFQMIATNPLLAGNPALQQQMQALMPQIVSQVNKSLSILSSSHSVP